MYDQGQHFINRVCMSEKKQHGGVRDGAGRPKGRGPHGEPTQPMRIPISMVDDVRQLIKTRGFRLPFYEGRVPAGHPVEAAGNVDHYMTPHDILTAHPENSFIVQVKGDSMIGVGIHEGDWLVVDTSIEPRHGHIVVAGINGNYTVKRLVLKNNWMLQAENPAYPPIELRNGDEFGVAGVVVTSLRHFRK